MIVLKKISTRFTLHMVLCIFLLTILFIPFFLQFQKTMFVNYEKKRMISFADNFVVFYHDHVRVGSLTVYAGAGNSGRSGETVNYIIDKEDIEDYIKDNNARDYEIWLYDESADAQFSSRHRGKFKEVDGSAIDQPESSGAKEDTDSESDDKEFSGSVFHPDQYSQDAVPTDTKLKKSFVLKKLYVIDGDKYYLYCRESLKTLDSMFAYTNRMMLILLALYGVVCTVVINILSRKITEPIKQLSEVTDRIAKKDYSVRYSGRITGDEIGTLADNVNHMANTIQENITSLQNWNYLLHDRIDIQNEHAEEYRKAVAILTHEMKTPLAVISSQIEMMNTVRDESKRQFYYSNCMEEIDKLSRMISRILNDSARKNSIFSGSLEEIDISRMVEELCVNSRSFVESHSLHLETDIKEGYIKNLYKEHIECVFNNYLMNAVRHADNNGQILVRLIEKGKAVRLSVFNEGAPIPEKDKDRIWMDFFQTGEDRPSSEEDDTYGLGLFIVKEIAAAECTRCGFINCKGGVEFWFDFINI